MLYKLIIISLILTIIFCLSCGDASTSSGDNEDPDTVTDIDGNVYNAIRIGDQVWMAENLKVTHYNNGDSIPSITDPGAWEGLNNGAYSMYDNDSNNVSIYGLLYNWYAVNDSRNIAPAGWRVPTDDDWKELEMYLGMSQSDADGFAWRGTDEGGKLKETGIEHWISPNTGATNESGFTALPGGNRNFDGTFVMMGYYAYFWTSTKYGNGFGLNRYLFYKGSGIVRQENNPRNGFSVRCLKD
jgi:uncharacterized protein (TIGR02145 family)